MATLKGPSRVIDGPFANWGTQDENCQISLANGSQLQLGQPLCIDVTQFGPDNNVPNNSAGANSVPFCERVVVTTSANAGPIFGVIVNVNNPPKNVNLSYVNGFTGVTTFNPGSPQQGGGQPSAYGVPTWTNNTGSTQVLTVTVRQFGFAYVLAGTAQTGQAGGNSINVGSQMITSTSRVFAIQGTAAIQTTVGVALATAINTVQQQPGAAMGPGVVSVIPDSLVGFAVNTQLLIDSLASNVQESVSVGSISYPTISIALANAHTAGFRITGPNSNPANSTLLISTVGAGKTAFGLVACFVSLA